MSTATSIEWTEILCTPGASADLAVESSAIWLPASHGSDSLGAMAIQAGHCYEASCPIGLRRSGIRVRWLAGGPAGRPQRQPCPPSKPHQHDNSRAPGWQIQPDRRIPLVSSEPSCDQLPHHVQGDQQHPKQRSDDPHHQPLARGQPLAVIVPVHAANLPEPSHARQLRAARYRLGCSLGVLGAAAPSDDKTAVVQSTGQVGGRTPKTGGRLLDGRTWGQFPRSAHQQGELHA
jgi:hypothetical protein